MVNELQKDEDFVSEYNEILDIEWKIWKNWKVGFEKIILHEDYKGGPTGVGTNVDFVGIDTQWSG